MSSAPENTPRSPIAKQIGPADTGMRGFLAWVNAAFTGKLRPVAQAVLKRAAQLQKAGLGACPCSGGASRLSGLGQSNLLSPISVTAQSIPMPTSSTVSSASSAPASGGWASDLSSVISAAASAYTTANELSTVNKITNINLARAQQGLSPIPTDLASYGVTGLGVNLGLSSSTLDVVMLGGAGLLGVILIATFLKHRAK